MNATRLKTVAVIGASTDRRKFGNKGVRAFAAAGWQVFPVNPNEATVEALPCVAAVTEIDGPLDVVSLYVPASVTLRLLPGIMAKAPAELWINPGAESRELLDAARAGGVKVRQTCSIIELGSHPSAFPNT